MGEQVSGKFLKVFIFFLLRFIYLFYVYECSVFMYFRRENQTLLQMVVSHYVVVGN